MTPSGGERWLASGMWEGEPTSEVTVVSTPDPEDACVDVRYDPAPGEVDGSERLLPRACLLRRLAPAPPDA